MVIYGSNARDVHMSKVMEIRLGIPCSLLELLGISCANGTHLKFGMQTGFCLFSILEDDLLAFCAMWDLILLCLRALVLEKSTKLWLIYQLECLRM